MLIGKEINSMQPIEWLGISASVIILISFLMKNILWVRLVNIVGAIVFVIYGIMIGAISVWLLNGMLVVVHMIYLGKYFYDKKKIKVEKIQQE